MSDNVAKIIEAAGQSQAQAAVQWAAGRYLAAALVVSAASGVSDYKARDYLHALGYVRLCGACRFHPSN